MRPRKPLPEKAPVGPPRFTEATLKAISKDLVAGKMGKNLVKVQVTDELTPGLRSIIYQATGAITFTVGYVMEGSRPYIKIGEFPDMSIAEARELAKIIQGLAKEGIDVQYGLHDRLIKELKRDGMAWRPNLSEPPAKKKK